ncbi:MAG: inorganic phosphate transporter [Actinomycetaceae bacterium]|nr:inorganic phosphate transporter [Actinomycetaceae bacterium]MDY6083104.1 inorganic phosphate transporter [Actinomycetaceae bacterium]
MSAVTVILVIVIVTALAFDFTNGFHDTANAMATSISTGALKPFAAVAVSAAFNVIGALLSVEVATTITAGIVDLQAPALVDSSGSDKLLVLVFAGLVGAILWNMFTWLLGLPSSSSHAIFGGIIGAAVGSLGLSGVQWSNIMGKLIVPAVVSPVIAAIVAACATALVYWITNTIPEKQKATHFRHGQVITACLVSLAHGAGDAQKTMGVIFLALIATGHADATQRIPFIVIIACAAAIALGTLSGGWRVIRTLGKGLVDLEPPQGMAAEATSAAIILTSAAGGMALSTTHVTTGAIIGTGFGKKGATVRWGVALRMVSAWIITLPCAALVGFLTYEIAKVFWNTSLLVGVLVDVAILLATVAYIIVRARRNKVDASNVNAEWIPDTETIDSSITGSTEIDEILKRDMEKILSGSLDSAAASEIAATQAPSRRQAIAELREQRESIIAQLREIDMRLESELFAQADEDPTTRTQHRKAPGSTSEHVK